MKKDLSKIFVELKENVPFDHLLYNKITLETTAEVIKEKIEIKKKEKKQPEEFIC